MTTDKTPATLAVDVLTVMGIAATTLHADNYSGTANRMDAARVAVAELIQAGAAYAEIVASSDNWTGDEHMYFAQMAGAELDSSRWVVIQMAQSRFESALARVKGESV